MAIRLTEAAAQQIRKSLTTRGRGIGLRVGVKKVGCSGYAYTFDFADAMNQDDVSFESGDARLVVAAEHLPFLDGSTLDYAREGLRRYYRFDNPRATSTCGCGESFGIG